MELELKAIREQSPDHEFHLISAGLARSIGPSNRIVFRGIEPCRSPCDLAGMYVVCQLDHPVHGDVSDGYILAPEAIPSARRVRAAGFDRGDRKFRLRA